MDDVTLGLRIDDKNLKSLEHMDWKDYFDLSQLTFKNIKQITSVIQINLRQQFTE